MKYYHRCTRCGKKTNSKWSVLQEYLLKLHPPLNVTLLFSEITEESKNLYLCRKCIQYVIKWDFDYIDNDDDVIIAY